MPDLRAVVVMDYQNVHLTAHELFAVSRHLPRHEALVDPMHFGIQLIAARNRAQRPGMDHAVLAAVLVYRGQPSAEHDPKPYARNQAQKAHWERDGRVSVTHRPLKYRYERDAAGQLLLGVDGKRVVESKGEKALTSCARWRWSAKPSGPTSISSSSPHTTATSNPRSTKPSRLVQPRSKPSPGTTRPSATASGSSARAAAGRSGTPASAKPSFATAGISRSTRRQLPNRSRRAGRGLSVA